MAFNPFHWFRKHQKVVFAGLIIMCMFVFIASFGAGDVVQRGLAYFGAARGQGEMVVKVEGSKVYDGDLEKVARRRKAASDFLHALVNPAPIGFGNHSKALQALLEGDLKSPEGGLKDLQSIARNAQAFHQNVRTKAPQMVANGIRGDLIFLAAVTQRPEIKADPTHFQIVQTLASVLGYQLWQVERAAAPTPDELYFGGTRKVDDLLDFLVWKHQADKLGVTLTDADVRRELSREAGNREPLKGTTFESSEEVQAFIGGGARGRGRGQQGPQALTAKDLLDALRDEFRVSMTQAALLGQEPGVRGYRSYLGASYAPSAGTPDEYLQWYRDQRTTLRVKFMALPVEKFVDSPKVRALQPTDAELDALFGKYREQEPRPDRREPGFKEPQRIAVSYAIVAATDPYYRELARQSLASLAPFAIGSAAPVGPLGTGVVGQVASLSSALLTDPVGAEVKTYQKSTHYWASPEERTYESLSGDGKQFPEAGTLTPQTIRDTVGSLIGNATMRGTLLAPLVTYVGAGAEAQRRETIEMAVGLLGAVRPPLPGAPAVALPARLAVAPLRSSALPFHQAYPTFLVQAQDNYASILLQRNLSKVGEKLKALGGDRDKAQAYIKEAIQEYHLHPPGTFEPGAGEMRVPGPRTYFEILQDVESGKNQLGLKPLYEAAKSRPTFGGEGDYSPKEFVNNLFLPGLGTYEVVPLPWLPRRALPYGDQVFFWRTRENPAVAPPNREAVFEKVKEAWYFDKARQVARAKAVEIVAKIKGPGADRRLADEQLSDPKRYGEVFELEGLAKLWRPEREPLRTGRFEYRPYEVPQDKRTLFSYAPRDLAKQLMALKTRGDAMVIVDAPARTYYVAVLEGRDDRKELGDFFSIYRDVRHAELWRLFEEDRRREYRKMIVEGLRREAVGADKIDKDGKYVVPESSRQRFDATRPASDD